MFEYLKPSYIGKDGIEYMSATVNPYRFDEDGRGSGKNIVLVNNHIKGTYTIEENKHVNGFNYLVRTIEKGNDETITIDEFKIWLIDKGYSDEEFTDGMKKHYPDAYEKYYKC